jgi:hypothetical protein
MFRIKPPLPTNAKRVCLVVPLTTGAKPFKKQLARKDKMENCLIFDFEILDANQKLFEKKKYISFDYIVKTHVATSKKIQLRQMGVFGKGAFSTDTIKKDEFIIYAGQLWSDIPLTIDQKLYFFTLYHKPKISLDGEYTENHAK